MGIDDNVDDLAYPSVVASPEYKIKQGDARDLPLDDDSVDLIITSPPYFQKRDYGLDDQIGQEGSVSEYIDSLMDCLDEWERVLRDTGTIFLNIGDKYKNLSKMGIPWKVAQAARDQGWNVRNEILWQKTNGVPTSADDRFHSRHEWIFFLSPPESDYYFDDHGYKERYGEPLDVWEIPHDQNEEHLAPYPTELAERCLVAACPPAVCLECGSPRRRIVEQNITELDTDRYQSKRAMEIYEESDLTEEHIKAIRATGISDAGKGKIVQNGTGKNSSEIEKKAKEAKEVLGGYFREFTFNQIKQEGGWSKCDCECDTVSGKVLDPFCGSGTTIDAAGNLGFSGVGVDLDPPEKERKIEQF